MKEIREIDIDLIDLDDTMREELGNLAYLVDTVSQRVSIGEKPLASPIKVREKDGRYKLIYGERRLTALKHLGINKIEAIIEKESIDEDRERYQENKARKEWEWYEEAKYFKTLSNKGRTQIEIGKIAGIDQTRVSRYLSAYEVKEKICELAYCPYNLEVMIEISVAPEVDWDKLYNLAERLSQPQMRNLVSKIRSIREKIRGIKDERVREQIRKEIEPKIFDDDMTEEIARIIIEKALDIHISKPKSLVAWNKIIPRIQKFHQDFSEYEREYDFKETETHYVLSWKVEIPKKLYEYTSEDN